MHPFGSAASPPFYIITNQRSIHVLKGFYYQTLVKYCQAQLSFQDDNSKTISSLFIPWRTREEMKTNASNFRTQKLQNPKWSERVQFILHKGYLFYLKEFSASQQHAPSNNEEYEEFFIEEEDD